MCTRQWRPRVPRHSRARGGCRAGTARHAPAGAGSRWRRTCCVPSPCTRRSTARHRPRPAASPGRAGRGRPGRRGAGSPGWAVWPVWGNGVSRPSTTRAARAGERVVPPTPAARLSGMRSTPSPPGRWRPQRPPGRGVRQRGAGWAPRTGGAHDARREGAGSARLRPSATTRCGRGRSRAHRTVSPPLDGPDAGPVERLIAVPVPAPWRPCRSTGGTTGRSGSATPCGTACR